MDRRTTERSTSDSLDDVSWFQKAAIQLYRRNVLLLHTSCDSVLLGLASKYLLWPKSWQALHLQIWPQMIVTSLFVTTARWYHCQTSWSSKSWLKVALFYRALCQNYAIHSLSGTGWPGVLPRVLSIADATQIQLSVRRVDEVGRIPEIDRACCKVHHLQPPGIYAHMWPSTHKPPTCCILSKLRLIHHHGTHLLLIRMVLLFSQSDFPVQSYELLNVNNTQHDFDCTRYL